MYDFEEHPNLTWADDFEELDGDTLTEDFLCTVKGKFCIATVGYDEAGYADWCNRSNMYNTREDALKHYAQLREAREEE